MDSLTKSADLLEYEKLQLESEKVRGDLRLREKELELKAAEQQRLASFMGRIGPLSVAVFTAFLALVGNVIVALTQGNTTITVERSKTQTALISDALKNGDAETKRSTLLWYLDSGVLLDPEGRIRDAVLNKLALPAPPEPQQITTRSRTPAAATEAIPLGGMPQNAPVRSYDLGDLVAGPIELYGVQLTVSNPGDEGATLASTIRLIRPLCTPQGINGRARAVLLATAKYADGNSRTFELRAFSQSPNNREEETSAGVPIGRAIPDSFTLSVQGHC